MIYLRLFSGLDNSWRNHRLQHRIVRGIYPWSDRERIDRDDHRTEGASACPCRQEVCSQLQFLPEQQYPDWDERGNDEAVWFLPCMQGGRFNYWGARES